MNHATVQDLTRFYSSFTVLSLAIFKSGFKGGVSSVKLGGGGQIRYQND
jgi:hypothetical protein